MLSCALQEAARLQQEQEDRNFALGLLEESATSNSPDSSEPFAKVLDAGRQDLPCQVRLASLLHAAVKCKTTSIGQHPSTVMLLS